MAERSAPGHVLVRRGHLVDVQQLAALLVAGAPFCVACGCSEQDACEGGCAWIPGARIGGFLVDLCTSCAEFADKPEWKRGRR